MPPSAIVDLHQTSLERHASRVNIRARRVFTEATSPTTIDSAHRSAISLAEKSRMRTIHFHPRRPVGASVVLTKEPPQLQLLRLRDERVAVAALTHNIDAHRTMTTHCTSPRRLTLLLVPIPIGESITLRMLHFLDD